MTIKLHRYYGDAEITKSVMEVFMDGEEAPRMVCEAREVAFKDYTETFPGASRYCLPVGRWRMKVGRSPYSPMGLRVPRCPGHRQVFIGHKWARQWMEGEVLIGEPVRSEGAESFFSPLYLLIIELSDVFLNHGFHGLYGFFMMNLMVIAQIEEPCEALATALHPAWRVVHDSNPWNILL